MTPRYFFVVPTQVHLLDVTGPSHLFYELKASGYDLELHFLRMGENSSVTSSAGLAFARLENFGDFVLTCDDTVFLPGLKKETLFDRSFIHHCQPFFCWLRQQQLAGVTLCSVCTGAFLLAEAGVLDHRLCTTHWKYLEVFQRTYPKAELIGDRLFVRDGTTWTSAGVSSGIDLALHLITDRFGPIAAARIAKETVVYLRRGLDDPQLSVSLRYRNHLNDQVHQAQDYLAQRLAEDCSLATVAAHVNMSPRNLSRRFKQHTGLTLGEYLQRLRIEKANSLLEKGYARAVIAAEVGLRSLNQLRTLLGKDLS